MREGRVEVEDGFMDYGGEWNRGYGVGLVDRWEVGEMDRLVVERWRDGWMDGLVDRVFDVYVGGEEGWMEILVV